MKPQAWVVCRKCGTLDKSDKTKIPHHIGTSPQMQCPDCCTEKEPFPLCRRCCPTGHGTRFEHGR